jgi:hypothetical protein
MSLAPLLILERLDLVLLALNLALLLLNLRLGLSLFGLPILHRIANQSAAEQAQTTPDGRSGAGIAREGADYRTGRRATGRAVDGTFLARGKRLSRARAEQEGGGHEHCRDRRPHALRGG